MQRDARASSGSGGVTRTAVGLCGHGGGVGGGVHSCHVCVVLGDHLWDGEKEEDGGIKAEKVFSFKTFIFFNTKIVLNSTVTASRLFKV